MTAKVADKVFEFFLGGWVEGVAPLADQAGRQWISPLSRRPGSVSKYLLTPYELRHILRAGTPVLHQPTLEDSTATVPHCLPPSHAGRLQGTTVDSAAAGRSRPDEHAVRPDQAQLTLQPQRATIQHLCRPVTHKLRCGLHNIAA